MGSGSSKPKQAPPKTVPIQNRNDKVSVTNVNSPIKKTDNNNIGKVKENSAKNNGTPVKSVPGGFKIVDNKRDDSPEKIKKSRSSNWDTDSDFEDDLDQFIKETVAAASTTTANGNDDSVPSRPRTSHGRSNSRPQNSYPETYAQKHTREQYTVDREMLIRQKTIYRNPDEWKSESEDEAIDTGGFDASKFRKVNTHKDPDPKATSTQQEFETPRYIKSQDNRRESSYGIYDKERTPTNTNRRMSSLPTYDLDEQRLLADLEMDLGM